MTNETRFIINHKTIFIKLNSPKFKKREFKILFYISFINTTNSLISELTNHKKVILYKTNKGCIISRNGGTFMIKYIHKKENLYNNFFEESVVFRLY